MIFFFAKKKKPHHTRVVRVMRLVTFILFKNIPKLINQQLKNEVKIVNWKKKVSYFFFFLL